MKVIIRDLIGAEIGESLPFTVTETAPKLEDLDTLTDLRAAGVVEQLGDRWLVKGTVEATLRLSCIRCLKEFEYPIQAKFAEEFVRRPQEEDQFPAGDVDLGLAEMFRTVLLLAIPDRPLHDPDCKGLCAICGKDLNEEPHDHPEHAPVKENPFSKLKEKPQ